MPKIPLGYHEVDVFEDDGEDEDDLAFWRELKDETLLVDHLPSGFHVVDVVLESRPEDDLSWSEDEVRARLVEAEQFGEKQSTITCGYCRGSRRFRTRKISRSAAVSWFRSHPCGVPTEATIRPSAPERIPQLVAA